MPDDKILVLLVTRVGRFETSYAAETTILPALDDALGRSEPEAVLGAVQPGSSPMWMQWCMEVSNTSPFTMQGCTIL